MFDWWIELPPWARLGFPLALLVVSTVLFFNGIFWAWGWAIGVVLLIFNQWAGSDNWA